MYDEAYIIEEALAEANSSNGTASQNEILRYTPLYRDLKAIALKSQPDPYTFTYKISGPLLEADVPLDRGYAKAYKCPASCLNVERLNPDSLNEVYFTSVREAFMCGKDIDSDLGSRFNKLDSSFVVVDGIIHTDVEVESIMYSYDIPESEMPPEFRQYMIFKLARRIALRNNNKEQYHTLKPMVEDYYGQISKHRVNNGGTLEEKSIISWHKTQLKSRWSY